MAGRLPRVVARARYCSRCLLPTPELPGSGSRGRAKTAPLSLTAPPLRVFYGAGPLDANWYCLLGDTAAARSAGSRLAGRGSRERVGERVRVRYAEGGKRAAGRSRQSPTQPAARQSPTLTRADSRSPASALVEGVRPPAPPAAFHHSPATPADFVLQPGDKITQIPAAAPAQNVGQAHGYYGSNHCRQSAVHG